MSDYSVCEALSNAAKLRPTKNETAVAYSKRIVQALASDDFPEDDWEALPDEAQQWVNEQIRATNERKDITPLAHYDEFYEHSYTPPTRRFKSVIDNDTTTPEATPPVEEAPVEQPLFNAEEVSARKETASAPPPRVKRSRVQSDPTKPNAIVRIREMLLEDFSLTPNEILERLKTEGYRELSRLTATSVKADFRTTLKFLQEKNLMSREVVVS